MQNAKKNKNLEFTVSEPMGLLEFLFKNCTKDSKNKIKSKVSFAFMALLLLFMKL